jgi:4-aminobutyrate aminotransferase
VARDDYNIAGDISLGHYTHEKSPLGCAAALATIHFIESENLLQKADNDGVWFKSELEKLQSQFPVIGDVRGIGMLWGIELVKDQVTKEKDSAAAEKIMYDCMRMGLSFKVSQGNVLQLSPALTISRDELLMALSILALAFTKHTNTTH